MIEEAGRDEGLWVISVWAHVCVLVHVCVWAHVCVLVHVCLHSVEE